MTVKELANSGCEPRLTPLPLPPAVVKRCVVEAMDGTADTLYEREVPANVAPQAYGDDCRVVLKP
eukprot:CAMPEP_0119341264 /NCGR_PEP_ID=MMETSP1333-20130426/101971_1 /TAXON_ID=418940 /ORGANISM="Scyphosphaera apsteinii, Strain RCC1455" /LENGTH=64 /DNA_ID=CAMNT_0007353187 /DNA_START=507 /DNA_END=701 /DNA_ORIENTATION=-